MGEKVKVEKLQSVNRKGGFIYKVVERNDKAAIYEQFDGEESTYHWEVFKIEINAYREIMERLTTKYNKPFNPLDYPELKEMFPSNESFGRSAWCYTNLDKAFAKYKDISAYDTTRID